MDSAHRRAEGKDAQSGVTHAHWGYSTSENEAAVRGQARLPSPVIAKIDLDQTLVDGQNLHDLKRRKQKKHVVDCEVHETVLKSLKKCLEGSSAIYDTQRLKTNISNALAKHHGPECAAQFEREVAIWTQALEVTLPGPDNRTRRLQFTIPMVSVKAGTLVYAKLPLELDQAFIEAAEVNHSTVQKNWPKDWENYIKDAHSADGDSRYFVLKLPDNISDLADALFQIKVASEMAAGMTAEEAADASGQGLCNTLMRVATRNLQPSYITAALAALDPEGRILSIKEVLLFNRDEQSMSIGKPAYVCGGNIFNYKREFPFSNCVVVGIDNNRREVLLAMGDDHDKELASESFVPSVKDVTLAGGVGNVDHILVTLERAAKAAGLGDLDLFASYDSRPLQQRQLSGLSSNHSRQLGLTGLRRNWEAAAAAAAAVGGHQGSPAAHSAAHSPAAGSPMAVDGSAEAAARTPAPANQAADGRCKPDPKAEDRELTPGDKKSPDVAEVVKKSRKEAAAAGTSQPHWQAAAVAGSSSGNQMMPAAGYSGGSQPVAAAGAGRSTQQVAQEGGMPQVPAAGGNSSHRQQSGAAGGSSSGRLQIRAAGGSSSGQLQIRAAGGSSSGRLQIRAAGGISSGRAQIRAARSNSSGGTPLVAAGSSSGGGPPLAAASGSSGGWPSLAAAGGSSSGLLPFAAAGSGSNGRQGMTAALPGSSSSSGGGAAASLEQQSADAPAPSTSLAAAAALPAPQGHLPAWEQGVLNNIRIDPSAANQYVNDLLHLTQEGLILTSPPDEFYRNSTHEFVRTELVAIGPDAVQQMKTVTEGVQPHMMGQALQKLQPIEFHIDGRDFCDKYSKQQRNGQCLLVEARKVFKKSQALIDGTDRQCDRTNILINKSVNRWQPVDEDCRQLALNVRVCAIVLSALAGYPQLPQGLQLFTVEQENGTGEDISTSMRGGVSAAAKQLARV